VSCNSLAEVTIQVLKKSSQELGIGLDVGVIAQRGEILRRKG
jgi:hypothetical protein